MPQRTGGHPDQVVGRSCHRSPGRRPGKVDRDPARHLPSLCQLQSAVESHARRGLGPTGRVMVELAATESDNPIRERDQCDRSVRALRRLAGRGRARRLVPRVRSSCAAARSAAPFGWRAKRPAPWRGGKDSEPVHRPGPCADSLGGGRQTLIPCEGTPNTPESRGRGIGARRAGRGVPWGSNSKHRGRGSGSWDGSLAAQAAR